MANYPIPNWIPGAPDLAQQFLGGLRAGSEIAAQQAQLNQEANLAQMRAIAQQQQFERENALEQQRLAQQQAYQTAQIGIQKQELQQAQQLNQIKIQQAARTFQAQQQFQQWLQDNPDKDPAEGILKFFPGTDESMTGYGTLARNLFQERQRLAPPELQNIDVNGNQIPFLRIPERGGNYRMQEIRATGDVEGRTRRTQQITILERRRDILEKQMTAADQDILGRNVKDLTPNELANYKRAKTKQDAIDKLDTDIERLIMMGGGIQNEGAPPPNATPAGGAQFRFNEQTGKIEPVGGGDVPAPAPTPVPAGGMLPPQPQSLFNAPATAGIARPFQMPKLSQMNPISTTLAGARNFATGIPWLTRGAGQLAGQGATNLMTVPQWIIDRWKKEVQPEGQ